MKKYRLRQTLCWGCILLIMFPANLVLAATERPENFKIVDARGDLCEVNCGESVGVKLGDDMVMMVAGKQHLVRVVKTTKDRCVVAGHPGKAGQTITTIPWSRNRIVGKQVRLNNKAMLITDAMIVPELGIRSITFVEKEIIEQWNPDRWTTVQHVCLKCKGGNRSIEALDRYENKKAIRCNQCQDSGWLKGEEAAIQYLVSKYQTIHASAFQTFTIGDDKYVFDPFHKVLTDSYSAAKGQQLETRRIEHEKQAKRQRELVQELERKRSEEQKAAESERLRQQSIAAERASSNDSLKKLLVGGALVGGGILLFLKTVQALDTSDSGYSPSYSGGSFSSNSGSTAASSNSKPSSSGTNRFTFSVNLRKEIDTGTLGLGRPHDPVDKYTEVKLVPNQGFNTIKEFTDYRGDVEFKNVPPGYYAVWAFGQKQWQGKIEGNQSLQLTAKR